MIALVLIVAGSTTTHMASDLTFVRTGHDIATFTEAGALTICSGHVSTFNLGAAVIVADRCVPDRVFANSFDLLSLSEG